MLQDTIVEEIREVRDRYAKQFKYNLWEIYKDLKTQEAKSDRRLILSSAGEKIQQNYK